MIPYIAWQTIQLGPITLQVWGLFVALGFLLGTYMAARLARSRGDDPKAIVDLVPWLVLASIVGGRLGDVLFYNWPYYLAHPLEVFAVWHGGLSFFGGLIASLLVAIIYFRKKQLDFARYADILAFGLPFGYLLGRVGCFLIHDHPGTATSFLLGVKYPDGVIRHDLGLDLAVNAFFMSVVFLWLSSKPRPLGTYLAIYAIWYGLVRFWLDFYRLVDVRYFGFTPAQYLCLGLVVFGLYLGMNQVAGGRWQVKEKIL